ncbi:MAG: response regulator [Myxococcota bacterium]
MVRRSLIELLVAAGLGSLEQFEQAATLEEGREVLTLAFGHERQLAEALAERQRHPVVVLGESTLDLRVLGFLPQSYAQQYRIVPIAFDDTTLTVACADVEPSPLTEQLSFASGRRILALLCVDVVLEESIAELYGRAERGEQILAGAKALFPEPHLEVVRPLSMHAARGVPSQPDATRRSTLATPVDQLRTSTEGTAVVPPPHEIPRTGVYPLPKVPLPSERAPDETSEGGRPTVLVVEDDDAIRTLLVRALRHDGYDLLEAPSGDGAAQILRGTRPNLIVLDAMLPGMHGFELCARVKAAPDYAHIPVLMLSAVYQGWEVKREILERHGADAFVEKPFELQYVRHLVGDLLQRPLVRQASITEFDMQIQSLQAALYEPMQKRDWAAALPLLDQWVSIDPFDAGAWLERGNVLMQLGELAAAMISYETATVYDSRLFAAFTNLAFAYERLGFLRKAVATWQRSLQLATDEPTRENLRARLAALHGG